ncbi:allantoinase [Verrucomicrobium sp. GAS474]|uniref:hypothetical protein n=1 Tax=Verrucomicrobium sp. GAS474 TaxID=1882831 RepID=UPI00087B2F26|nr:hypothetical protein [Verrucomicrobium sp. GAS474]SDT95831.1 allantoinase [Verrucomicrobium sp. GAS474]
MTEADLLIRGGYVALPGPDCRMARVDIAVADGKIVALGPGLELAAAFLLEASGLVLLPGVVDPAVRFLPAQAETRITAPGEIGAPFAAGGGTLYADLPGGRNLPLYDPEGLARKKAFLLAHSRTDFALWAGISGTAVHFGKMEALRDAGIVGFHASLAPAERDGAPPVAHPLLLRAMKEAARLGLPVHLHTESGVPELPAANNGLGGPRSLFLESHPPRAEDEAVRIALDLAGEAGCALFLSPLTLVESLARIEAARAAHPELRVTTGSAAHHLLFSEEDGAAAAHSPLGQKFTRARPLPPLRSDPVRAALFAAAASHPSPIDLLLSGHAEAHGMRTAQHAHAALLTRPDLASETGPGRARLASRLGPDAAAFLGLADRKGGIALGKDADLLFLDLEESHRVGMGAGECLYAERESLYAGQVVGGRIVRVLQRGRTLFANGRMAKIVKEGEVCFIPRQG